MIKAVKRLVVVFALVLVGCSLPDSGKPKQEEKPPKVQINPHAIYIEVHNNESAPAYKNLDWDENVRAFITHEIYRQANVADLYHCSPATTVVRDEKVAGTRMIVSYGIAGSPASLRTASIQLVDGTGNVKWVISDANYFWAISQAGTMACGGSL